VVGISVAVHAVLIMWIKFDRAEAAVRSGKADANASIRYSCEADARLAYVARLGMCASPFGGKREACLADARMKMGLDETSCSAVQITMVDPESVQPSPLVPFAKPQDPVEVAKKEAAEIAKKVEEVKKQRESTKPGQVVEITKPTIEKAPDKARFLSEYDSSVAKETVARNGTQKMVERPEQGDVQKEVEPAEPKTVEGPPRPEGPAKPDKDMLALKGEGTGDKPESSPLSGPADGPSDVTPNGTLPRKGPGLLAMRSRDTSREAPGGGDATDLAKTSLFPSTNEDLARAIGGGSVDKLDGVASGDKTGLNSRQWKHAGFFNRMKRQVAQNWHPDQVYVRRDPSGKVYGTKDRLTVLNIALHPDGRLARAWVADASGVGFLDDEAIKAFQIAQPFPNPPSALIEGDSNLITFRFGFHFHVGDRSRWKLFRQR